MTSITITETISTQDQGETLQLMLRRKQRQQYWKPHETFDDAGLVVDNTGPGGGFHITDPQTRREFTTIKKLGEGGSGVVYSAVAGILTPAQLSAFKASRSRAQYILKAMKRSQGETLPELLQRTRREYDIGRILFNLAPAGEQSPCETIAVCGETIFIAQGNTDVIGVSPYTGAIDLFTFIYEHFYDTFDADPKQYHIEVLKMVNMLCNIIDQLNRVGLFHMDVKPENIIVSFTDGTNTRVPNVLNLRMIDFGLSCFMLYDGDTGPNRRYVDVLRDVGLIDLLGRSSCAGPVVHGERRFMYKFNQQITDPRAGVPYEDESYEAQYMFSRQEAEENFPKFEQFATTLVFLRMLDRIQESNDRKPAFTILNNYTPMARKTRRTIPGLINWFSQMTSGPLEDRPSLHQVALYARALIGQINQNYPLPDVPLITPLHNEVVALFTRINAMDDLRRVCGPRSQQLATQYNLDTVLVFLPPAALLNAALSAQGLSERNKKDIVLYHCVYVTQDVAKNIRTCSENQDEMTLYTLMQNAILNFNCEQIVPPRRENFVLYETEITGYLEFVQPEGFESPLCIYRIGRVLRVN